MRTDAKNLALSAKVGAFNDTNALETIEQPVQHESKAQSADLTDQSKKDKEVKAYFKNVIGDFSK